MTKINILLLIDIYIFTDSDAIDSGDSRQMWLNDAFYNFMIRSPGPIPSFQPSNEHLRITCARWNLKQSLSINPSTLDYFLQ
jgi:hypothetical protein